ncbi:MAG: O-antigen ligase family protein [Clostridia bacterium]|nr:O-antigen ligase family protein [Clostridia bacterium]
MAKRKFIEYIDGYTTDDKNSSGKKFSVAVVTGSANRVSMSRAGKYIASFFEKLTKVISYTPSRTYGAFLAVFGALSLVLHFVKDYIGIYEVVPLWALLISSFFALLSVPFLLSDKPLSIALQSNRVTDFVFFEFFCIRRMHKNDNERGIAPYIGIILGVIVAVLGAVFPLRTVVLCLGVLVYVFLTFLSPEFSFFSIFLMMPYLSFDTDGLFLAALVGITLISYMRKVALGKRVYFFEQYDLGLFIMLFCILISGIFVKGVESFVSSVVMILLGMGYILASSLVTNRRLADGLTNAVIISAVPVSVIAIVQSVVDIVKGGLASFEGACATFDSPSTLSIFLLVALCFSAYFVDVRRKKAVKVLYAVITCIIFVALISTMSFWAFGALIIGTIAFAAQKMRHGSGLVLLLLSAFTYLLLFIPSQYRDMIYSSEIAETLGLSDSIRRWQISFMMLRDNLFLGVGIGDDSFVKEIINYTSSFDYSNSGNFLLELACEAGIISLFVFIIIYLIRVRHRGIYQPYVKNSLMSKVSTYTTVLTVILMAYGAFNYIWADMAMYYLFWCVFGLGSAALRVSKSEFDDRVAYFSDGSAEDSSSIDISIRR